VRPARAMIAERHAYFREVGVNPLKCNAKRSLPALALIAGAFVASPAAAARSIGSCECASSQSAVSTARRRSFGAALGSPWPCPETSETKRAASSVPISSRPISRAATCTATGKHE